MSINFHIASCQEPKINNNVFGLCDDQKGLKAYTNTDNKDIWIATVYNENGINLTFTAVDKCVIKDNEYIGKGRCDGILTSHKHIFFIELKF